MMGEDYIRKKFLFTRRKQPDGAQLRELDEHSRLDKFCKLSDAVACNRSQHSGSVRPGMSGPEIGLGTYMEPNCDFGRNLVGSAVAR
jgi:hypothetical protein